MIEILTAGLWLLAILLWSYQGMILGKRVAELEKRVKRLELEMERGRYPVRRPD